MTYAYTSDWIWNGDRGPILRILDTADYSLNVFEWPGDGTGSSVFPSPDGARLYAPSFSELRIIDLATGAHTPIPLTSGGQGADDYSYGVGFSPADNKLYVAASGFDAVNVIDTARSRFLGAITVGYFPNGLVVLTGGVIFHGGFE
jgi:YVTN family beta-propeller protein